MKNLRSLSLFAALGLIAASQDALAASKKADAGAGSLVSALQAVSPDPLGGRLGLAIAAARNTEPALAPAAGNRTVQTSGISSDLRAYLQWKKTQKS